MRQCGQNYQVVSTGCYVPCHLPRSKCVRISTNVEQSRDVPLNKCGGTRGFFRREEGGCRNTYFYWCTTYRPGYPGIPGTSLLDNYRRHYIVVYYSSAPPTSRPAAVQYRPPGEKSGYSAPGYMPNLIKWCATVRSKLPGSIYWVLRTMSSTPE